MVRHTLRETGPKVLATRMVRDYVQALYVPAGRLVRASWPPTATPRRARSPPGGRTCCSNWPTVRVAHVEATGGGDTPEIGSTLALRAEVELPGLAPGDVEVQAAYGRVDDADGLHQVTTVPMAHEHTDGSRHWFTATASAGADGRLRLHRARAPALGAHGRPGGARGGDQCVSVDACDTSDHAGPMHPV